MHAKENLKKKKIDEQTTILIFHRNLINYFGEIYK